MKIPLFKIYIVSLFVLARTLIPLICTASSVDGTVLGGTDVGYAWSENAGYVNFGLTSGNIHITDSAITGYAWDGIYGWLNLGPILVGGVDYGVKNTKEGRLSGYAWSAGAGWVSFDGISIDSKGRFSGTTSDAPIYGRLTFDCSTYCNIQTDWRPSSSRALSSAGVSGSLPYTGTALITFPPFEPVRRIPLPLAAVGEIQSVPRGIDGRGTVPSPATHAQTPPGSLADIAPSRILGRRLLDISFAVERAVLSSASDLVTRVSFVNFGDVPSLVLMEFSISDQGGVQRYRSEESITVQTENLFIKRYKDLVLPSGMYTARLHTKYNDTIIDDFSAQFTVKEPASHLDIVAPWWAWYAMIIVPPCIFWIVYGIFKIKRQKNSKQ